MAVGMIFCHPLLEQIDDPANDRVVFRVFCDHGHEFRAQVMETERTEYPVASVVACQLLAEKLQARHTELEAARRTAITGARR